MNDEKLKSSILALVPPSAREKLYADCKEYNIVKSDWLKLTEPPTDLAFVLNGEIALRNKTGNMMEYGRVVSGRSIELKAFFLKSPTWDWAWQAQEDSKVFVVPWKSFVEAFASAPQTLNYLHRMAINPELQKLKRDLRSLGTAHQSVETIINSLKHGSFSEAKSRCVNERLFFVVSSGRMELNFALDGTFRPMGSFQLGETLIYDPKQKNYFYEVIEDVKGWYIFESEWKKLKCQKDLEDFFEIRYGLIEESKDALSDQTTGEMEIYQGQSKLKRRVTIFHRLHYFFSSRKIVTHSEFSNAAPACLASAAAQFGYKIGVKAIKFHFTGSHESGVLNSIARVAHSISFTSKKYTINPELNFKANYPTIIDYGSKPLLLFSILDHHAEVGDTQTGAINFIAVHRLTRRWNGRVLEIFPTAKSCNLSDSRVEIFKYFSLLKGNLHACFLIFLASSLSFLFSLTIPMFNQFVFERMAEDEDWSLGAVVTIGYFASSLIAAILTWASRMIVSQFNFTMDAKFTSAFVQQLVRLPVGFFDSVGKGELFNHQILLKEVQVFVTQQIVAIAMQLTCVTTASFVLYLYHPKLLWTVSLFIIPLILPIGILTPTLIRLRTSMAQHESTGKRILMEICDWYETVKLNNSFRAERWRWEANFLDRSALAIKAQRFSTIVTGVNAFTREAMKIAVLYEAVQLSFSNNLSVGKVVAAIFCVELLTPALVGLLEVFDTFPKFLAGLAQVDPIFSKRPEAIDLPTDKKMVREARGKIRFENVDFRYSPTSPNILTKVNLEIAAGEKVAIVGMSGSGKSTLVSLFNGLRKPSSGNIFIDDISIKKMSLATRRKIVGMIPQGSRLFSGSLIDNISMFDPQVSFERVAAAAYHADAEQFITRLPQGYSSMIAAGGTGLSVGQAQRILIARMIYEDFKVFILDESTSHLDPISEERLLSRFLKSIGSRTLIFVSQHVNLLSTTDKIIFVHNGTVAEIGRHEELLHKRGLYYEFLSRQQSVAL